MSLYINVMNAFIPQGFITDANDHHGHRKSKGNKLEKWDNQVLHDLTEWYIKLIFEHDTTIKK